MHFLHVVIWLVDCETLAVDYSMTSCIPYVCLSSLGRWASSEKVAQPFKDFLSLYSVAELLGKLYVLRINFLIERLQRSRSIRNVNKPQTWIFKKVKVRFWLSLENIYVCTIIGQLLVCRIIMQLNEKRKVPHLTCLFSSVKVRIINKQLKMYK